MTAPVTDRTDGTDEPGVDAAAARTYADSSRSPAVRLLATRDAAVLALLVAVVAYAIAVVPNFDSQLTVYFLVLDIAPILMIALPMTLVIVTGEIDLSVASVVAVTSVLFGVLTRDGVPIAAAAVLAVLAGSLAGAVNGLLVTRLGLPSLAVTIGTLALYRGIAVGLLGTTAVTDWPQGWRDAVTATFGESRIPVVVVPLALLALGFGVLLHLTSFGRGLFAIGLSASAARFSGVDVERSKLVAFVLTGTVAGIAGVYFTLRYGSSRGDNATGMELQVIAAVLLGGVSIFGGRGAIPGVLGGVLLIGVIGSALRLDGQSANVIQIVTGVLLVASVVSAAVLGWVSRRIRRRPATADDAAPPAVPTAGGMSSTS